MLSNLKSPLLGFLFLPMALSAKVAPSDIELESQSLASALIAFANTYQTTYIASGHLIRGKIAAKVQGTLTAEQAIKQLLVGSGLTYRVLKDGTFLIVKPSTKTTKTTVNKDNAEVDPLEVILVRSTKRPDTAQNIPIAASVIGNDQLVSLNIKDVRDFPVIAQSLSYHGAITSAGQGMRIRGVGSGVIATGIEQSVGTVIDDVITGPSGSGLQTVWDVDYIEVLRGPQGTLFGKNVSAGAIHQITNEPSDFFEAGLSLQHEFEYDETRIDGVISGPLNDKLTARVAAFSQEQKKGTINNIVRREAENANQRMGLRVKLNYQDENWWSKLSLAYSETDDSCCGRVFSYIDNEVASGATNAFVIPALDRYDLVVSDSNRTAISEAPLYEQQKILHARFEWGKDFASGHKLKTITGYRNWQHKTQNDGDNLDLDVVSFVADERHLKLFSQEIQWLSPENADWEYVIGGYFYKQHFPSTEYIGGGADIAGFNEITYVDSTIDTTNVAVFGHSTYYFNNQLALFSGLRLLHESAEADAHQYGDNWIWPTDYAPNHVKTSDNDFVANLGMQFWFENANQVYASISRGYKGKAIDNSSNSILYRAPQTLPNGTVLSAEDAILNPETVINIELGSKNQFDKFDTTFNATLFHSRFTDFQASAYDGNSNSFKLTNAGTVESKGIELELAMSPWQDARLYASTSWIDARFKTFTGAPCQVSQSANNTCSAATGGQDLSGKQVNENPEWQVFFSFQQAYYIGQDKLAFEASYAWRDDVIYDADLDPNTTQEAFSLINLRLGYSVDNWQITGFINNATDTDYANRIIDAPIWRGAYQRYPEKGRTFGLRIDYLY